MILHHPNLYRLDAAGDPELIGISCSACGFQSFPHQDYGCEKCGAHGEAIARAGIAPTGTVVSSARVDFHTGDDIEVPFRIAEIRLPTGTKTRVILDSAAPINNGTEVFGVLVPLRGALEESPTAELRFTAERDTHGHDAL